MRVRAPPPPPVQSFLNPSSRVLAQADRPVHFRLCTGQLGGQPLLQVASHELGERLAEVDGAAASQDHGERVDQAVQPQELDVDEDRPVKVDHLRPRLRQNEITDRNIRENLLRGTI